MLPLILDDKSAENNTKDESEKTPNLEEVETKLVKDDRREQTVEPESKRGESRVNDKVDSKEVMKEEIPKKKLKKQASNSGTSAYLKRVANDNKKAKVSEDGSYLYGDKMFSNTIFLSLFYVNNFCFQTHSTVIVGLLVAFSLLPWIELSLNSKAFTSDF